MFILIIEQGFQTIKFKRAFGWLDQNWENEIDPKNVPPAEITIGSGQ